jgi:hypothetical protein
LDYGENKMKIFAIKQKRIQVISAQSLVSTCQDWHKSYSQIEGIAKGGKTTRKE